MPPCEPNPTNNQTHPTDAQDKPSQALSRRLWLKQTASLTGLFAMGSLSLSSIPGCESTPPRSSYARDTNASTTRGVDGWPTHSSQPVGQQARVYRPSQSTQPATAPTPLASPVTKLGSLIVIPRSSWTTSQPLAKQTNPMNGIKRVTVHHEGMKAIWATDQQFGLKHMAAIRNSHVNGRKWGDIGYHYVIDRAGNCYEGRPISRQGAHVSQNNEHNVGVMLMGNFELQAPSQAQLTALVQALQGLQKTYRISRKQFYTHREFKPTACPGRNLQPRVDSIRSRYL